VSAAPAQNGAAQAALPLALACPVCGRPFFGGAWPGNLLCGLHLVQWNGAVERLGVNDNPELLDLVRQLAGALRAVQPEALVLHVADEVLARAAGRMPEQLQRYVDRKRAELEKQMAKLRGRANKDAALESDVQKDIVKALHKVPGLFFWRANAGGSWIGEQFVRSNRSGTADLICVVRVELPRPVHRAGMLKFLGEVLALLLQGQAGRAIEQLRRGIARLTERQPPIVFGVFLGLEVKRPGEGQRPSQVDFEQRVRAAGGFYAVATNVDEALAAVERARRLEGGES